VIDPHRIREDVAFWNKHRKVKIHTVAIGANLEVLEWLAAGKTDREIGEILGMSPRTVQKHLQHIYEKLGVETRTAAVMRALGK